MRPRRGDSTRPVDLGWLFLLPGIALLAAGVLIAAEDDVYEARFHRDQALAIERRHAERVERYRAYLEALERQDPTVVRSLVVSQLNAAPTDLVEEPVAGAPVYDATEVFSALEPEPAQAAERVRVDSVLARWATRNESRTWLLASGALCVFVGMLPPATRRGVALAGTASSRDDVAPDGHDEDRSVLDSEETGDEWEAEDESQATHTDATEESEEDDALDEQDALAPEEADDAGADDSPGEGGDQAEDARDEATPTEDEAAEHDETEAEEEVEEADEEEDAGADLEGQVETGFGDEWEFEAQDQQSGRIEGAAEADEKHSGRRGAGATPGAPAGGGASDPPGLFDTLPDGATRPPA